MKGEAVSCRMAHAFHVWHEVETGQINVKA